MNGANPKNIRIENKVLKLNNNSNKSREEKKEREKKWLNEPTSLRNY